MYIHVINYCFLQFHDILIFLINLHCMAQMDVHYNLQLCSKKII